MNQELERTDEEITDMWLKNAWACTEQLYLAKSEEIANMMGTGINMFHYLKEKAVGGNNCEYLFIDPKKDRFWEYIMNDAPNANEMRAAYNAKRMFLVGVQVPMKGHGHKTAGTFKIFQKGKGTKGYKEIKYPKRELKMIIDNEKNSSRVVEPVEAPRVKSNASSSEVTIEELQDDEEVQQGE